MKLSLILLLSVLFIYETVWADAPAPYNQAVPTRIAPPPKSSPVPQVQRSVANSPPLDEAMVDSLDAIWSETSSVPSLARPHESSQAIQIDSGLQVSEGDYLKLWVPQESRSVVGHVTEADNRGGVLHLVGVMMGAERVSAFTVTLSPGGQYFNFSSSTGRYEVVARDGLGWITPSRDLLDKVDGEKVDYVLPDQPGPARSRP